MGIITVAGTRCSPRRAVVVAVFAPERRGGTNEIAVSDTAVHTNRSAGRASTSPPHDAPTPTDNKSSTSTASQDHHEPDIAFAPNSPDRVGRAVVEDVEPGRGREPADTSRLAEIRGDLGLQLVVADADGAV
ncbi:hypothetical protein OG241_03610 [Streptomyces sp. NBC_01390]